MRYILMALMIAGCADASPTETMRPPVVTVSASNPFDCYLDADLVACHCTIPTYSSEAIAEMTGRCNFLRDVAADLY